MDRTGRTRRVALVVLAVIVAIAALVRWPIAERLLPHWPEPDAYSVLHAQDWRGDPARVQHAEYAQRYPKLLAAAFATVPTREPDPGLTGAARVADALACAAAPYLRGRLIVLAFSLLALPLTWLVARRFLGDTAALMAVWLIATSLLHELFSTQARPHGPHLSAALFAILSAQRLVERPNVARSSVAVLGAALAMGTLQNGAFTLFPLATAAFLAWRSWPRRLSAALVLPGISALLALAVYPVLPTLDARGFHLGGALSHDVNFHDFTFRGLLVSTRWFSGHDPMFFVLTVAGAAAGAMWLGFRWRALGEGRHPQLVVGLSYVVPYSLLLIVTQDVYERFLLPLLPWFAIAAALPWRGVLEGRGKPRFVLVRRLALVPLLAGPLVISLRFAWVALQPDTLQQAASWIANDPTARAARIAITPMLPLPLPLSTEALARGRGDIGVEARPWTAWQLAHEPLPDGYDLQALPANLAGRRDDFAGLDAWFAERQPGFVVLEISRKTNMIPSLRHVAEWTRAHGELVHRSSGPAPERDALGLCDYQSIERPARRLFGMSAFGPEIEIWRITR